MVNELNQNAARNIEVGSMRTNLQTIFFTQRCECLNLRRSMVLRSMLKLCFQPVYVFHSTM